jgi:hypothetical protein
MAPVDMQDQKIWREWERGEPCFSSRAAGSIAFAMKYISSAVFRSILMVRLVSALAPPHKLPKLVLLDRDGVINEDVGSPLELFSNRSFG